METVKTASKALSDGSGDESLSPTYRHSWTMKQRLTLAMLAKSYSNNWNEKTAVFNHFHRSDLRRGGLRRVVVSAQFNDMRTWFNAANALKKLRKSLSPYDRLKLASQRGLEKKALDIGIQLIRNGPANSSIRSRMSDKHDAPGSKRKRVDPIDDGRTDCKALYRFFFSYSRLLLVSGAKSSCHPPNLCYYSDT